MKSSVHADMIVRKKKNQQTPNKASLCEEKGINQKVWWVKERGVCSLQPWGRQALWGRSACCARWILVTLRGWSIKPADAPCCRAHSEPSQKLASDAPGILSNAQARNPSPPHLPRQAAPSRRKFGLLSNESTQNIIIAAPIPSGKGRAVIRLPA